MIEIRRRKVWRIWWVRFELAICVIGHCHAEYIYFPLNKPLLMNWASNLLSCCKVAHGTYCFFFHAATPSLLRLLLPTKYWPSFFGLQAWFWFHSAWVNRSRHLSIKHMPIYLLYFYNGNVSKMKDPCKVNSKCED